MRREMCACEYYFKKGGRESLLTDLVGRRIVKGVDDQWLNKPFPGNLIKRILAALAVRHKMKAWLIVIQYVLLFGRWLEDFLNFAPDFVTPNAHNVEENVSIVNVQLEQQKKGRFSSLK